MDPRPSRTGLRGASGHMNVYATCADLEPALRVHDLVLLHFDALIGGARVDVRIRPSRIEWSIVGRNGVVDMMPRSAIRSTTINKVGYRRWQLTVIAANATVQFRLDKTTSARVKDHLGQRSLASDLSF